MWQGLTKPLARTVGHAHVVGLATAPAARQVRVAEEAVPLFHTGKWMIEVVTSIHTNTSAVPPRPSHTRATTATD